MRSIRISVMCLGPDFEGIYPLYTSSGDLNPQVRRGDVVRIHPGEPLTGRFVGRSCAGVDWVVYDENEAVFAAQCDRFDKLFAPRELM